MNLLAQASPLALTLDDVLSPYILVFVVAFIASFCLTPIMRILAVRNGIVDWPDLKRKAHVEPVAYLGGVAIFLGWMAGIFLCFFTAPHSSIVDIKVHHVSFPMSVIIGAMAITLTGLVDDVYGISPRIKIGGQLFAAAALASEAVGTNLAGSLFDLAGIQAPFWLVYGLGAAVIALFVIGGCNSLNLLDGLDGLSSGVTVIAHLGFLFIAVVVALGIPVENAAAVSTDPLNDPVRVVMCLATLGAILGFLPYNFNPANIFMGDAGSLLLGYLSVATILMFAHAAAGPLLVMAALIVFALPITDTTLAIVRRKMKGQPIFSPDSNHLHHQLFRAATNLGAGKSLAVKMAVLSMYALAALFAVLGCSMVFLRWRYVIAVFSVVFGFIIVTAYKSGHRQVLLHQQAQAQIDTAATPAPTPDAKPPVSEPAATHSR